MRSDHHPLRLRRFVTAGTIAALLLLGTTPVGAETLPTAPLTAPTPPVPATVAAPQTAAAPRSAAAATQPLVGTFKLTAGACSSAVQGSRFRMIQPGGNASGPFVSNADSPCSDKSYTPMLPGSDGGLITGAYQPQPAQPFDGSGNGRSARITKPQKFFGVDFATATNSTDPQTGLKVTAPAISHDGSGHLSGDLRAFAASWNTQHFNQGAPKPDGSTPGATVAPTGTFNEATGAFVLEWTSQIVGGSFNGFTGQWHFEGTFTSSAGPAQAAPSPGGPTTSTSALPAGGAKVLGSTTDSTMANTGPTFPSAVGLWLFAGGLLGLGILNRQRGTDAIASSRDRG